jgi:hypothetical protein
MEAMGPMLLKSREEHERNGNISSRLQMVGPMSRKEENTTKLDGDEMSMDTIYFFRGQKSKKTIKYTRKFRL